MRQRFWIKRTRLGLFILYSWIAYNTKHAMREKGINIYNSMRYKIFWGAGVTYIKPLAVTL